VSAAGPKIYVLLGVAITLLAAIVLFSYPRVISSLEAAQDRQLLNAEVEQTAPAETARLDAAEPAPAETPVRSASVTGAPVQPLTRRAMESTAAPMAAATLESTATVPAPVAAATAPPEPQAVTPQTTVAPQTAVAPQAAVAPQGAAPAAVPAPMSPRQLSDEEIEKLRVHARHLLAIGDISGARLFLQRAIAAGCPVSTMTMAETYDPEFLAKNNVIGMAPDPSAAKSYYKRAFDAGNAEAEKRLERLQ